MFVCIAILGESAPRDDNCFFVGVVDVDFVLVKNRNVVSVCKFGMLRRESRSIPGTMCTSFAGWRKSCCSSSMLVASSTSPLGMQNALSDCRPVAMNVFLVLSLFVPTLEVAPLSAMAEGMEPSRTPCFNSLMLLTCSTWSSSCSSTWQVGGAVKSNIE